ncbi:acetylserotonin O-methyltransferase [Streptomyces sp. HPF1205]|uniref:acetylserotonin O-methyltransferase n=1 Tax=Streptomyces sp. HPF1205 TaxID=2873262 RepID=UPI001CEC94F1|nr:acetylserotonin O-methyltransferase [Streptomyces sp. HPF1205]
MTLADRRPAPRTEPITDAYDLLMVGWSFVRGNLLMSAVELGLFEALAKEPGTAEQLTLRLGLHERGTRDFLDALAALGVLRRDGEVYRNSPAAEHHLIPGRQDFVGGFLAMTTQFMGGAGWNALTGMLRTGEPHGHDAGSVPFDEVFRDRRRLQLFLSAMDSLGGAIGPELAKRYDWSRHSTFVDVGGARGNLAGTLLLAHPHLTGGVFDRPVMEPFLDELARERGVADRLAFHGGDFHVDALPAADVLIFGNVLHDLPVGARRGLIARAARRVPPGGTVLVYDPMLDDDRTAIDNLVLSLVMMMQSPAGNEYPPAQCRSWMEEAGLRVEDVFALPAHATAVVGRRPA